MKNLNVISKNYKKFNYLEDELFNKKGIAIQLTNNRKKSLLKSQIVINQDFDENELKRCNLNKDCYIINVNYKIYNDFKNINACDISINKKLNEEIKKHVKETIIYESILYEMYGDNSYIDIQQDLDKNVIINKIYINNAKN